MPQKTSIHVSMNSFSTFVKSVMGQSCSCLLAISFDELVTQQIAQMIFNVKLTVKH